MTWALWLELIKGVLQFPDALLRVVQAFKKTPEENHEALVASIETEAKKFAETGRPS